MPPFVRGLIKSREKIVALLAENGKFSAAALAEENTVHLLKQWCLWFLIKHRFAINLLLGDFLCFFL